MKPTVSVLMIVPMPTRCPSGIQVRSTTQADEHDDEAERQAGDVGEALVEHVPRRDAELGVEHRRDADAEDEDADEQARQAARSSRALGKVRTCSGTAGRGTWRGLIR